MKKRILSMLLVLVMVIGMIPFSALSASAESVVELPKGYSYNILVKEPVPGEKPSYDVTIEDVAEWADFKATVVKWYKLGIPSDSAEMSPNDTFEEDEIYCVYVEFEPVSGNSYLGGSAMINGVGVTKWANKGYTRSFGLPEYEADTWDEFVKYMGYDIKTTIRVTADITKTLNYALEGRVSCRGDKTLILEGDITVKVQNPILEGTAPFDGIISNQGKLTIEGSGSILGQVDMNQITCDLAFNKRTQFFPVAVRNTGTFKMNGGTIGGVDAEDNMFGALLNYGYGKTEINGGVLQGVCNYYNTVTSHGVGDAEDVGYYEGSLGIGVIMRNHTYNGGANDTVVINGGEIRSLADSINFYHTYWIADRIYHIPEYLGTGQQTVNWLDMGGWDNTTIYGGKFTSNTGAKITWTKYNNEYPITQDDVCDFLKSKSASFTAVSHSADYKTINVTVNLDMGFASLTPKPDMDEADWDELASDLGTMALGSADTNINFNFSAKTLPADAIEAGYSVKRALKVTRDGITIYDKEYESNEVYAWNLKDNIDEGGNYHIIPTLNYYLDGVKIEEISHLYTVKVTGSTIKTISLAGIGTPVIGLTPSSGEFAFTNTDGVIIKKVQWEYWTSEMGGSFVNMPDGSVFEEGKRYAVLLELETAEGYAFAANKEDMTVYINGEACNVFNHDTSETVVELEMTPITDPAFIVKPVGGNVEEGDKFTITWETNFKPAWIQILSFNSANGAPNDAIDVPADATSFELDANEFGYVLTVYYNGNQCVSSVEKFYVNEIKHISEINVTVAPPKAGEAPADATTTESGYTISTQWWVLEEDGQYRPFEGDFEAGKQYAVYTLIEVKAGYELANNPTIKVNGDSNIIRISSSKEFYSCVYELITINTIEIEVAKPVIGEAPTKPTIKSVNGDENLKDLVSFFSDSKVYWVEADSAEDIAYGNKNPTVFADGKIYALHVAIQSTKEIAEDCVLNVYGTDGELLWSGNISFSDPSDKTLVYTDAYLGNFKLEIGNVNGDDLIDFTDLQRLYQHITGDSPLSGDALAVADVNGDTVVDFSDLQALYTTVSQNA